MSKRHCPLRGGCLLEKKALPLGNVINLSCRGGFPTLPQPHETEHFPKSGNGQSRNCKGGLQTLPYKWNA